jgi:hypothetical protein
MKSVPKTKKGKEAKMKKVFKEFGAGTLNIGKSSKKVSNPKQAVAIALSSSGISKKKRK